ncbi:hypothetical protein [Methanosarcina barkeri]|uniref:Uncharacterized protein n=1 Tax=Methanosarcina barkeri 227 TaxID=1434106 RepID=A0A0E3R2E4_METBA|nr:hypothetical protein [Methanosarcina barkeri]AKB57554.1 hypothetical protein MSBR2_1038 [Methanosarcina barkeri 227]
MTKETDSGKCVLGGTGITAGENVIFENINSPIAVGANINISFSDIEDLKQDLLAFKEAISKSNLLPENKTIAEGDITAAIKESENETPKLEKITKRVVSAIEIMQETGKKMEEYGLFDIASKVAKRLAISAILN